MYFDYHIHTPLCRHAQGHPREYVQRAIELGMDEIGFADHNPMPEQFDDWRMAPDELPDYLHLIEEAREAHPGFPIRLGLECDFLPGYEDHIRSLSEKAPFDYLIGSVHYIQPDWAVDNPYQLAKWKDHPVEDVWRRYFKTLAQAADSRLFDFLAHPDLVKKFGHQPQGDLRRFYGEALDAIADNGLAIEINTAGWRKEVAEQYPSHLFLEEAFRRQIPLLINSDAHAPHEVGSDFDRAKNLASSIGYREIQKFENRHRISVPLR